MNKETKLILESLRMLLWENWRKYELIRVTEHPEISSVELNEIADQVEKINAVLNPKEEVPYEKSLEVCEDPSCGHHITSHYPREKLECNVPGCNCKKFVKKDKKEKEMYCAIDGCGEIDGTQTAFCIEHGRSPHKRRFVNQAGGEE